MREKEGKKKATLKIRHADEWIARWNNAIVCHWCRRREHVFKRSIMQSSLSTRCLLASRSAKDRLPTYLPTYQPPRVSQHPKRRNKKGMKNEGMLIPRIVAPEFIRFLRGGGCWWKAKHVGKLFVFSCWMVVVVVIVRDYYFHTSLLLCNHSFSGTSNNNKDNNHSRVRASVYNKSTTKRTRYLGRQRMVSGELLFYIFF